MDIDTRTLWFLLVGDPGVGKTSFFNALKGKIVEDEIYRYSYNRKIKRYYAERGGVRMRIHVYDVAQGRPDINIHYSGVDGVLFLYDITKKETFTNLTTLWLRDCNKHAPSGTNKIIIGNKIDQKIYKTVGKSTAKKYADSLGIPFLESSTLTKTNVEEAIVALAKNAITRYFPESPRTGPATLSVDEPTIPNLPSTPEADPQPSVAVHPNKPEGSPTPEPRRDDSAPSDSGYDSSHPGVTVSSLSELSPVSVEPPSISLSSLSLPPATPKLAPSNEPPQVSRAPTPAGPDAGGVSTSNVPMGSSADVGLEGVVKELELMFGDESKYGSLRGMRGVEVQRMMDILQKLLGCQELSEELRRQVFKALLDLFSVGSPEAKSVCPRLLTLRGIRYEVSRLRPRGGLRKGYYGIHPLCVQIVRDGEQHGTAVNNDCQPPISSHLKEALTLSELNHTNILPFYGIFYSDNPIGQICIITPWMKNLHNYLSGNPEAPRLAIVFDILNGLKYLHDNSIVHGDPRGANVFVNPVGTAYLGNFGLRNLRVDMSRPNEGLRWQAPELMDELEDGDLPCPTKASDVYSAAFVMYEVLTGDIPFHEVKRDITIVSRVSRGIRPTKPSSSAALELNEEIWQIMQQCWTDTASERMTIDQLLNQLREIQNLPNLTNVRLWKAVVKEKGAACVFPMPLSTQSFRNAMWGRELRFSKDEVEILRKYSR